MKVAVKKCSGGWSIIPVDGKFAGESIGTVESIQLADVTFEGDSIIGTPQAVWGAEFQPGVAESAKVIRALGIGGCFDTRIKCPIVFDVHFCAYVDADTGFTVPGARQVAILNHSIFRR